ESDREFVGSLGSRFHALPEASPHYSISEQLRIPLALRHARVDLFHAPHYVVPRLVPCPYVVTIHDCIHLRFPQYLPNRFAPVYARTMMRMAGRGARRILTVSYASKLDILHYLRIPADRVEVIYNAPDEHITAPPPLENLTRTRDRYQLTSPFILYTGNIKPHKNLDRLIDAFGRTSFRSGGGKLVAMGGRPDEHAALSARLSPEQREYTEIRPFAGQVELETMLAACMFVVQPSLEEGFGLPAWEALSCGIPLCCSDGGSLPEITGEWADSFPAASTEAMTAALDACASRAAATGAEQRDRASDRFLETAPSIASHAAELAGILERALPGRPGVGPVD
ncbi:MAG TPA: glycosyltransferase family 1 protein, partial [Gemmatimonadales bacterium]|nr:glycosyltransferase family 1 protein [Gemmatimonadales bacterium]